jgi:bifunctional ADP-heptose synthase (sugar kinase/adenylyltransferase)
VVGADIVRAYGGEVKVSRLIEGQSTTATIAKLRS